MSAPHQAAAADIAANDISVPVFGPREAGDAVIGMETAAHHRDRRYRHYRGGHGYRYRHRRGPSVGDVLTGILILGTIGAVIDAVEDDGDRRRDDYRDRNYGDYRDRRSSADSRGLDRAIDMCIDAVERRERVSAVEQARRTNAGWEVSGTLDGGAPFSCLIDNNGRIADVDFSTYAGTAAYEGDYADGADDWPDYGSTFETDFDARSMADLADQAEQQRWASGDQYDAGTYARLRARQNGAYDAVPVRQEGTGRVRSSGDGRYDLSEVGDFSD